MKLLEKKIRNTCADPEGGAQGARIPLEKSQNIGYLSNIDPDLLKNNNGVEPAFNFGPSSVRQ